MFRFITYSDPRDYKTILDQVIKMEDEAEEKLDIVSRMGSLKRKASAISSSVKLQVCYYFENANRTLEGNDE